MSPYLTCKPDLIKNYDSTFSALCTKCLDTPSNSFKICSRGTQSMFCNFKIYIIVENDRIVGQVYKCIRCDIIVPDRILMMCDPLDEKEDCSCGTVYPNYDEVLCEDHKNTNILFEERPCIFVKEGNFYVCTKCPAFITPEIYYRLKKSKTTLTCRSSPQTSHYSEYYFKKIATHQGQLQRLVKFCQL